MFEKRPAEAPRQTSRVFDSASALVDVGKASTRAVSNVGKRLGGLMLYFQAVIWGFGALGAMATANSTGHMLGMLAIGCAISGGFVYAGKRAMSSARAG